MEHGFLTRFVQFERHAAAYTHKATRGAVLAAIHSGSIKVPGGIAQQANHGRLPAVVVEAVQPDLFASLVQLERRTAPVLLVLANAGPALRSSPIQISGPIAGQLSYRKRAVRSVKRVQHLEFLRLRLSGNNC